MNSRRDESGIGYMTVHFGDKIGAMCAVPKPGSDGVNNHVSLLYSLVGSGVPGDVIKAYRASIIGGRST